MNHFNMTCNCYESGDSFSIEKHFEQTDFFDNLNELVTFRSTPRLDWTGKDWITWHKELLQAFQQGRFKSRIKYPYAKALELTNKVFNTWFQKNASFKVKNFGGYDTEFFSYFKSVGLENILSIFQAIYNPVAKTATNVSQVVANVSEGAKGVSESIMNLGKWIPYIILIVVLILGYMYFSNRKS